jgi:hypothetical protein
MADDLNRSNVWRILCDNMKLHLLTGEQLLDCVVAHLREEHEEYTLPIVLQAVQWVLRYKLDKGEAYAAVQERLYRTFFEKLDSCKTKSMEVLILSAMIPLISPSQYMKTLEY